MTNSDKSCQKLELTNDNSTEITIPETVYNNMQAKIFEYQQIFNKLTLGIITLDKNLIYTTWNRFMEKLTGYKESEIVGKNLKEVFPELVELGLTECLDEILNGESEGFSIQNDFSIPGTDKVGTLRETYQQLFDIEGNVNGVLIKVDDVTERIQLYQALKECKSLMTLFFKNSPIYAYIKEVTETESRVLIASDNYINMIGIEASEMEGKTMGELFPQELAETMTRDDIAVVKKEEIIEKEEGLNGRKYQTIKFPIKLGGKQIIAGYTIDITDRKNAEENLRSTRDLLLSLTNGIKDLVFTKDLDGNFTFVNPALEKFLGKKSEEVLGKKSVDIIIQTMDNSISIKDAEVISMGTFITYDDELIDGEGKTRKFSVMKGPTYDKDGKLNGLFGISRDITDMVEKEELLKLREQQLAIKSRMELISTFAAGIAHNYNNLLSPITGYLELLLENKDTLTKEAIEYIEIIMSSANRAVESTKQIADSAKNNVSSKEDLDFFILVRDVFENARKKDGNNIKMINDLQEGAFYVKGNQEDINKVLLNLINNSFNAIKGENDNYIKISAKDYKSEVIDKTNLPEGDYVHIIVEDNGKGMSKETLNRAFEPFFTTGGIKGDRGQGLGLYKVYNTITNTHNGYIDIESEEGIGTKIHIYLPKGSKKEVEYQEKQNEIQEQELPPMTTKQTILVVDDDNTVREVVKAILEFKGYNVITAIDGEDGLKVYKENRSIVDCILLDLQMPKISGHEVLEAIRDTKNEVAIVILTGNSSLETGNDPVLNKANGLLKKPVEMDLLLTTIRKAINSTDKKNNI